MTDEPDFLSVRTTDVFALARSLRKQKDAFATEAGKILADLHDDKHATPCYGADPINAPAQLVMRRHTEACAATRDMVRDMASELSRLSKAVDAVVSAYRDQDGLNAADVDDVRALMNDNTEV